MKIGQARGALQKRIEELTTKRNNLRSQADDVDAQIAEVRHCLSLTRDGTPDDDDDDEGTPAQ